MAKQILHLLIATPLSKSEIAKRLGKKKPNRYLNDLMRRLLELDFVVHTIPEKPTSRLQKYRLTTKGTELFKQP